MPNILTMAAPGRRRTLYKPRPPGTLKAAEAALIEAVGGTVRAADVLGRSQSEVQRLSDAAEPDRHLNADQIRALERVAHDPIVTAFLAHEAGAVLLHLAPDGHDDLALDFAELGDGAAKLFGAYARALADDARVDAGEAGILIERTDLLMRVLAKLRQDLATRRSEP